MKKNSIKTKIWKYFISFSIIILVFLWIFQIALLPSFYESSKTKELEKVASALSRSYYTKENGNEFLEQVATIAHKSGTCIVVSDTFSNVDYTTDSFSKECMKGSTFKKYKSAFISSNLQKDKLITINPQFENKTLIYSLKLDDSTYIFASSSLVPIDSTVSILRSQFILVTIIVLIIAFIISYFISKKLSNPILKLTKATKEFGKKKNSNLFKIEDEFEEITELSKTLEYASNEVAQTEELRKELMANVSHDLKTPLTMIKAYAEMVRDITYKNKEKREQNLNVIIEETDRLNHLVNDILTLSVIESKMMKLSIEEFDLNELIHTILGRYEIYKTNEEYKFIYEDKQDIFIQADKEKLEQVLYNLINNAIQHSENKKIEIKITEFKKDYLIEIKNNGIPIPKEELEHIWNKYYKSKKDHQRAKIGTGLGLSIVKQILELHNYSYGVTSTKEKGTNFYFRIPK